MAEIDSLEVKISAQASEAEESLKKLSSKFGELSKQIAEIGQALSKAFGGKDTLSGVQESAKAVASEMSKATKDIQKSSKDAAARLSELAAKYADLGKNFQFFGNADATQKQIEKFSNALETAKLKKEELESVGNTEGKMYEYAVKDVQKYSNILDYLQKQMESLNTATGTVEFDFSSLDGAKEATKQLEDFAKELEYYDNIIEAGGESTEGGIVLPTRGLEMSLEQLKSMYPEAHDLIESFEAEIERAKEMSSQMPAMDYSNKIDVSAFGSTKEAAKQLEDFSAKLNDLVVPEVNTDNLKKLERDLTTAEQKVEELRAKLVNGLTMGKFTESLDDSGYRKIQEQIALAEKKAEALRAKIEEVGKSGSWLDDLKSKLSLIGKQAEKAQKNFAKISASISNILAPIQKLAGKVVGLASRMFSLTKATNKSTNSFAKKVKMIVLYSAGIRSLYAAIAQLKSAIKDGFDNLVQYSDSVNASVSMLRNSMTQLGNASAAAISPLINAFAPALNQIIQLCINAANAVNQLFSALTGSDTWIKATLITDDYAESLKNASGSASSMSKQLGKLDELNNLTSSSSSGSGGSTTSPTDMYETEEVETQYKDLAEKIKSFFNDLFAPMQAAWDNVGDNVMQSWKRALEEIKKLAKSIGEDFMTVWNQEETVAIFEDILIIISDIGEVVANLAQRFREAWDANNTGLHILENIRDIIGIIIHNIRLAADATVAWSENLDFTPLLTAFESFTSSLAPAVEALSGVLLDFYTMVMLSLADWAIGEGLPALLDVFTQFNNLVDWEGLRTNLQTLWEHLEPFAETVGEGLILFIEDVSVAVAGFVNSEAFESFLTTIENWMDNVTPEDVANGLEGIAIGIIAVSTALALLKGAESLASLINTFTTISTLAPTISTAFSGIGAAIAGISAPATIAVAGIVSLTLGLATAYSSNEDIRKSFQDAANTIQTNLQPAFTFLTDTIIPDLKSGWQTLQDVLKPLTDFLNNTFASIWRDIVNPALQYLGETIIPILTETLENLWNNVLVPLGESLASVLTPIIQVLSELLTLLWENIILPLAQAIGEVLALAFESFCLILNETVIPIVNTVITVFQFLWNNVFVPIGTFLVNTFQPIFEKVFKKINELIADLKLAFTGVINFITGIFTGDWEKAWNGVKDIFKGVFNGIISLVESALNFMTSGLRTFINGFIGVANSLGDIIGIDIDIPTLSDISLPRLAKGGVTTGEIIARIGENGREAIIPLENASAMQEIAGRITDNMSQSSYGNSNIASAIETAAYNGYMRAIRESQGTSNSEINLNVDLDGKSIYKNTIKHWKEDAKSKQTNPVPIFGV